jgi:hypothetical protein
LVRVLDHDAKSIFSELRLLVAATTLFLVAALNGVTDAEDLVKGALTIFVLVDLFLSFLLVFFSLLVFFGRRRGQQESTAVEADAPKQFPDELNESRMKHWLHQLDVAEVAWALRKG